MRFRFTDVMKTIIISLMWIVVISLIGIGILFLLGNPNHMDAVISLVGVCFIPIFIAIILTIKKHLLRKNGLGWKALGFVPLKKKQILKLVWQVPICWLLIIMTQVLTLAFLASDSEDIPSIQSSTEILDFSPMIFILVFLAYAILTPIIEEIVFRGGLFQALEKKFNLPSALLGSSLLFMLIHSFIPTIMPAIFVAGLLLAYLYQKYRSIYASMSLHMFINGINVVAVNFFF